jgi:hypothetical protein
MRTTPHPTLWQRLFRASTTAPADDAADMGTAMGLDFVLDEQPLPTLVVAPVRPAWQDLQQAARYRE